MVETVAGAAPPRALAGRWYTDPEVFEREKERILFRTWHYACHTGEVEQPGEYVAFRIADQGVFVVRDAEGALRAFYNVCQHRAHELLRERGRVSRIVCPYHAWTYDLDGRLHRATSTRGLAGFDAGTVCLTPVRVETFCGFAFVNLDADAAPMREWFGSAEDDLRAFVPDIEAYRPVHSHGAESACNWKVAVENYNECYHCPGVHPSFTRGVIAPGSVSIRPEGHTIRHAASGVAPSNATYEFDPAAGGYRAFFLWPATSIQVYPGRVVNTYWWRPDAVARTRVLRGWLAPEGAADEATLRIVDVDRETTFAEDLPVVDSVQRGLASRGYRPGPLVVNPAGGHANEESVHAIQRWVRDALGDDAPG